MWADNLPHLFAALLAAIFAVAAIIDLVGSRYMHARLHRRRHPSQFYRTTGALKLFTALFLATPELRIWGVILAGLITFFWVVTLLNHRQWRWASIGILVMMALVPASLAIH
jgi:hypothetical protein